MVREAKRANKVQDKEAKKQSSAVFRSGKGKGQQCTVMCLMCIATKCLISGSTLLLLTTDSIWDRFREKGPSAYYKMCYKNALCLNRCNSRTVHAIDCLFSTRHTTPFQYVRLYFGVLHKLCADDTRSDSP